MWGDWSLNGNADDEVYEPNEELVEGIRFRTSNDPPLDREEVRKNFTNFADITMKELEKAGVPIKLLKFTASTMIYLAEYYHAEMKDLEL